MASSRSTRWLTMRTGIAALSVASLAMTIDAAYVVWPEFDHVCDSCNTRNPESLLILIGCVATGILAAIAGFGAWQGWRQKAVRASVLNADFHALVFGFLLLIGPLYDWSRALAAAGCMGAAVVADVAAVVLGRSGSRYDAAE